MRVSGAASIVVERPSIPEVVIVRSGCEHVLDHSDELIFCGHKMMAIAVMPRTKLRGTWKECGADQEVLMQQIASPEPERERGSQAAHVLLGGEGFPSGKLSGDVRKGERETSQVVLR